MFLKVVAQLMVATTMLQFFPADVSDLESTARLPEVGTRTQLHWQEALRLIEPVHATTNTLGALAPTKIKPESIGVETTAISAIVIDRASGTVLFEKEPQTPRSIGSITKLMTALVFLEAGTDLDAPAAIEAEDVRYGGRQHVAVGDQVTQRDLLHASLVGSDNSATAALVRLSGMPLGDFVGRMNERAAEIGLSQTTFADSTGLSAKNRSVVTDLVLLFDEVMKQPVIQEATQQAVVEFTGASGRTYSIESTDVLLGTYVNQDPYKIEGAKTGYLPEAGYCLGSIFSQNGSDEIIVVVLGSESNAGRFQDVKSLATWAYNTYSWN